MTEKHEKLPRGGGRVKTGTCVYRCWSYRLLHCKANIAFNIGENMIFLIGDSFDMDVNNPFQLNM